MESVDKEKGLVGKFNGRGDRFPAMGRKDKIRVKRSHFCNWVSLRDFRGGTMLRRETKKKLIKEMNGKLLGVSPTLIGPL